MARALDKNFFERFQNGDLNTIVKLIDKKGIYKSRFMFNLRGDKVIIYYKCLKALTIYDSKKGKETKFEYTKEYAIEELKQLFNGINVKGNKFYLTSQQILDFNWKKYFSLIIDGIDIYSAKVNKAEKEVQQRIWFENNLARGADSTEYVIVDTEYTAPNEKDGGQFDLVALYWPNHKIAPSKIAMIELKYGQSALGGSLKAKKETQVATLKTHYDDFVDFDFNDDFYKDISKMFFQLHALEMIDMKVGKNVSKENLVNSSTTKQMMFVLANYNPDSGLLNEQIKQMTKALPDNSEVVFAMSSCCGYGLYGSCMIDKNDVAEKLGLGEKDKKCQQK